MTPCRLIRFLLVCAAFITIAVPAHALQLTLEVSALEKLLVKQVFRDDGKWRLGKRDTCNDPYLESPSVQIRQGRILVKARFAGRLGHEIAGICVSFGEPSWLSVSGRPTIDGQVLMLSDVRVEGVEKPAVRAIASELINAAARSSLRLDLQQSLRQLTSPANTDPYVVEIADVSLKLAGADHDRLQILIDLSAVMR